MAKIYNVVMHPKNEDDCPTGLLDCDNCDHRKYIGTLGGDYYVDCELS